MAAPISNNSIGFLDATALDLVANKESLKTFLKGQSKFRDYNFDGSDISVLLDLLAVNYYRHAFLLNMVGSEMFQDTAQLRESNVSHAKELNYVPRSRTSASALVNIAVTPTDAPPIVVVPKFYTFVAQSTTTNQSLVFSTGQDTVIRNNGGQYIASNVAIYEGRVVTEYFVASDSSRYKISSANVDISSIDVNIQNSSTDGGNTSFTLTDTLYGLNGNSAVYFLQGADANNYEIQFGNGVTGRSLIPGNIVKVTYRDCSADDGNGLSRFIPAGLIDGYSGINVTLSNNQASTGGAEREDSDSIKFNAPRHFSTQGRAVVDQDYETLILDRFPSIESLVVFGGEKLPQKKYGKVAICAKPYNAQYISNALKSSIVALLTEINTVTIDPIIIDADYFYMEVVSNVYYNPNSTMKTITDIESAVINSILKYADTNLSDFKSDFRYSTFVRAIDSSDASIVSNDTYTRVIKRIAPIRGQEVTTTFTFSAALETNRNDVPTLATSYFTYTSNGANLIVRMKDDGAGSLNIYQTINNLETVLVKNVGTVKYATGDVQINKLNVADYPGYINIYVRTSLKDFIISRNQLMLIDANDISLNVYEATT